MPNYNQTLQNNNSYLEEIITQLNNMPDAGEGGLDTNDATATSGDILNGKTAYVKGEKVTGNIAFQPAQTITPTTSDQIIASNIYLGGTQTIKGDANLVADNIVSGKSIFGVVGTATAGGGGDTSVEDELINGSISGAYVNNRVTNIRSYAFYSCSNLTSVNFPKVTNIGQYAFNKCIHLTSVSFPAAIALAQGAFQYCSRLTSAFFSMVKTIGERLFADCYHLTSVSFPVATTIYSHAFEFCSSLTSVSFPEVTDIRSSAFWACSSLTSVSFPKVTIIYNGAFTNCSRLTSLSFPEITDIRSSVFSRCTYLKALYLTNSVVCALSHSNAFSSTPIGGYSTSAGTYGSIYVPMSLVDAYKAATNWAFFSNRIFGI